MLVIMLNCVTLGMFRPCEDVECRSERCSILEVGVKDCEEDQEGTKCTLLLHRDPPSTQAFDDFIFAFFAVEMVIKMVALGLFGQKCYLGDTWNRLDFFIVMAGYAASAWYAWES